MKILLVVVGVAFAGCVVRPEGEPAERDRAAAAGAAYAQAFAERELPALGPDASLALLLAHAERANGTLEAAFHRWSAALERVPQASTQPTTAMVGLQHTLDGGAALDRTALLVMSDAMRNLLWPGRLLAQGEAALAEARVAGAAFFVARLQLQTDVATACHELALRDAELAIYERLDAVLGMQVASVGARVRAGAAMQQDLLGAQIAQDRARAERERLLAGRPALVAALRAAVGAGAGFADLRAALPALEPVQSRERETIAQVLQHNADLAMAQQEVAAALAEVRSAEWERVPEWSLSGMVMGSMSQTLGFAFSLPWLRQTAIDGMVAEAEAGVRAAEALRRQAASDAVAMALRELAMLDAVEREHAVLAGSLLPRLHGMADVARAAWVAGAGKLAEWTAAQAMAFEVELQLARLRSEHAVGRARLQQVVGGLVPSVP